MLALIVVLVRYGCFYLSLEVASTGLCYPLLKLASILHVCAYQRPKSMDLQVHTLDVPKQLPGPRWNVRQWCLYWKGREPHQPLHQHFAVANAGASLPQGVSAAQDQPQASNAAINKSGSSGGGQDADSEEDEADSAFVHQG